MEHNIDHVGHLRERLFGFLFLASSGAPREICLKQAMTLDDGQEQDIGADDAEHQRHHGKQILQEFGALLREHEAGEQGQGYQDEQYKDDAHAVLYKGIRKACPVWRA